MTRTLSLHLKTGAEIRGRRQSTARGCMGLVLLFIKTAASLRKQEKAKNTDFISPLALPPYFSAS